jgi:hypothetical protein
MTKTEKGQKMYTKSYRMNKRTAAQIKLLAVQNDLKAGQVLDALQKFQGASRYLRDPKDKALFDRVWGQSVLSARQAGKGGFNEMPDPHQVQVTVEGEDRG